MKLAYIFSIAFLGICPAFIFPGGIKESDITDPVRQYILPGELTGDFIIPDAYINTTVSIYPSNKYIISVGAGSRAWHEFGHIIKIDERYFFSPLQDIRHGAYISFLTGIYFSEAGFYFYGGYDNDIKMDALRKRSKITGSDAERINIAVEEKSRYFKRQDGDYLDEELKLPQPYSYSLFSLQIDKGEVRIVFNYDGKEVFWEGYLEITEETGGETKGRIVFTEGAAFRGVEDGISSITINEKGVEVIFPCIGCFLNREDYDYRDPLDMVVIF